MESLVIAGYVRGLSTRDVEASLADALGPEATLSKSTVSRICAAIADEFDTWRHRDLSDIELEYLYLDGSHFRYHDGARAEPVLCAWGITTTGAPVFLALDVAALMVDGICFADHCCVVALAVTADGAKVPVGLWLGDTENATVVRSLVADLVARGLDATGGLLW